MESTPDIASGVILAPGIALVRGVCRMFTQRGFASLTEFATRDGLRMDVLALGPKGEIWCVEVKSSRADFLSDCKWEGYLGWCDRFFFAVPETFPDELLPFEPGLIRADPYGADILRWGPEEKLATARRKAMTLQFARNAAQRVQVLSDPRPRGPVVA
ncbi:MAG TPA: MmcB family DNA repair protein [Thermohalobaculum sp.]|nr:MmcB family DNA repair protein [Thermohalobaculum sp.]